MDKNKNKEKEVIEEESLMVDIVASQFFNNNIKATELVIQTILSRKDIKVVSVKVQNDIIPSSTGKRIILDILAKDNKNKYYNIEMQNINTKDIILRSRYYASAITYSLLKPGSKYINLNDVYIIFICNFDLFNLGKPQYVVKRKVDNSFDLNDGETIIYVNCTYNDLSSDIGKLISDLKSKDNTKKWYNELKIKKGEIKMGVYKEMIYEEGYKEGIIVGKEEGISLGIKETTKNFILNSLKEGIDLKTISKITGVSNNQIKSIKEKN